MSRSRYERELEELLESLGDLTPEETRGQRFRRRFRAWLSRWQDSVARMRWTGIPTDQMMLGGIVVIVLAYVLRLAAPAAAAYVGLLGILLFFVAFGLAIRGGRRQPDVRWRSRVIDHPALRGGDLVLARFSRWWRRQWRD